MRDAPTVRPPDRPARRAAPGVLAAAAGLVILLIVVESPVVLAIVLMEGTVAWAVLAGAALSGGWIVRWIGLGEEPWPVRTILGAGLGIGGLALAVLGLGLAGALSRAAAASLAIGLGAAGLARLFLDARASRRPRPAPDGIGPEPLGRSFDWLWLLAVPFLAIALLAACLPPGVLWSEEGFGYDVLEYHLAVPKAWHDAGRITCLPHNVYSQMPLNAEMLFLLMMTLRGDAIEAAWMAQLANVAQAGLFVAAAWLAGRTFSKRAGLVAGLLAATAPWLAYLGGIAYAEPGMLALGMTALAALLRMGCDTARQRSWALAGGLLAGLACGYKYTAIPLIALPLALLIVFGQGLVRSRLRYLATYALAALAALSPWLLRNAVNTGNPVFPLAWSVFGANDGLWDGELEARWQRAHASAGAEQAETPVALRAIQRTVGEERMGYAVFVLAIIGALAARDRVTLALVTALALQGALWLGATHLFARFAVVLLLPLVVLAARAAHTLTRRPWPGLLGALVAVGAGWNLYRLATLYYHHTRVAAQPIRAYGQTRWFVGGAWPGTEPFGAINGLGPKTRVLLVGEARTFYLRRPCEYAVAFSHHPLAQAARRDPEGAALLKGLRGRGITHLLVHWGELGRLGATYGLDRELEPALIERLVEAGLKPASAFSLQEGAPPYATLFEVAPDE